MNEADATTAQRPSHGRTEYVLEPATIAALEVLRPMRVAEAVREAPNHPPEAVVALIRVWIANDDRDGAWMLAERLIAGIQPYVRGVLNRPYIDADTRDDIAADLACQLYQEWMSADGRHRFWEVRFFHCLKLRLCDAMRRVRGRQVQATASIEDLPDGVEIEAVESAVSPEERIDGLALLHRLPGDLHRVYWLKYYEQWTEAAIAAAFGVSSRTIRNWLRRARAMLDGQLQR
jgi:RNA polymerase sigma factor (sigma-70 family)